MLNMTNAQDFSEKSRRFNLLALVNIKLNFEPAKTNKH